MKTTTLLNRKRRSIRGMTLAELLVAVSLGAIVLTMVMVLYIFGLRSFAAMGNYAELNGQSRMALDQLSREVRQSTHVLDVQQTGNTRWITVANTNATPAITNKYTWEAASATMTWDHWQNGQKTTTTNLTGCDLWTFEMYTRAPDTNGAFSLTKDVNLCKLVNMNWKCTRTILGRKLNSEAVLTAEIVLRNKQSAAP
jgi:prepilin-type N-terminal cleavage/methylation domain-containing protein